MSSDESTRPARGADLPVPPPSEECGITVEDGDRTEIVLPRCYSRVDVVIAAVSAAIAVWVAVWVRAASPEGTGGVVAVWAVGALGALFAVVAVSQAFAILAPPVIQDRGDRIVLSRKVGVRRVLPRSIPKSEIEAVERMWERGEDVSEAAGAVWVRTADATHRIGKGLDGTAVSWLEDALRVMVRR
jgi:threonine dehydrogenase-like Zn-dependent dehydrogenase